MDEVSVKTIVIDDNKYYCIDEIISNNICYSYFSNVNDEYDVRVLIKDNDNYKALNNDIEYVSAMNLFYDKYNGKY